jgi:hypothetical protein
MRLNRLPPRITSTFDQTEEPHLLDGRGFKKACYLVAQISGGTVEGSDLNLLGRNYFGATIRTKSDHVSVLCNSVFPYLAFVPPNAFGAACPDLIFVKAVDLAKAFATATDFRSLDADWLKEDLSSDLLADLAPSERREITYWKPARVGEVVFNSWD